MTALHPTSPFEQREALFDALYTAHHRVLYAYLLGGSGDRETAEDLLQETFVRVWQHLDTLQALPEERHRFWLFAAARNLLRDAGRRKQVRVAHTALLCDTPQSAGGAQDPVARVLYRDTAEALDTAIRALPSELRIVLSLHRVGGLTSAEIGKILARPAGTVRYQLAMARRRLAREIGLCEE